MVAGREIERKFLLDGIPDGVVDHPREAIDQGYLAVGEDVEVRVRRRGAVTSLTVKAGGGRVRVEEEVPIDGRRFAALWPLTEGRRIRKDRYAIPLPGGLVAEVDVYREELAGLVTAEVEFGSEAAAEAFEPPSWIGRDVTEDPRYKNRALAVVGPPPAGV